MPRRSTVIAACLPAAFFALAFSGLAAAQPAVRITDVNDQEFTDPFAWSGQILAAAGTTAYFDTDDGSHGVEIWKTDGTPAGTRLLKDICPGACNPFPDTLTFSAGGTFFFGADDGSHGIELWHSDGTEAGTRLVKDVFPGLLGGLLDFAGMVDVDGTLFFVAVDGTETVGLWASDGTPAGTRLVMATPDGTRPELGAAVGGSLVFQWGSGLWVSDGTEAGTALLAEVGAVWEESLLQASTGRLFFTGHDESHGFELWVTDGTAAGTAMIEDIDPGPGHSFPGSFAELGGLIYFSASDGEHGWELWRSDGTPEGTGLVKDLLEGSEGSHPAHLTALGGLVLFRASGPGSAAIWKTDGTADGTVKIRDLDFGGFWDEWPFVRSGAKVYFFTEEGFGEPEIWESDGTEAGTRRAVTFSEPLDPQPGLAVAGTRLYFHAWSENGLELWQSDGTSAGTGRMAGVPRFASSFLVTAGEITSGRQSFVAHGDRLGSPCSISTGSRSGSRTAPEPPHRSCWTSSWCPGASCTGTASPCSRTSRSGGPTARWAAAAPCLSA